MREPARLIPAPLGWAIFLGMSWTWCIGMFLPVILVREFGNLGWLVFAIPNVIGAAAMGWVITSPQASLALVQRHRGACVAFSLITIAFHLFFAEWFIGHRLLNAAWGVGVWAAAYVFFFLGYEGRWDRLTSALMLLISLVLAAVLLNSIFTDPLLDGIALDRPGFLPARSSGGLAMACVFGFGLCPYLDLTFHRARQALSPSGAKFAFGMGFGLFFGAMIVLSLLYARPLGIALRSGRWPLPEAFRFAIGLHLILQSGLTIALHLREMPKIRKAWHVAVVAVVIALPLLIGSWASRMPHRFNMDAGEMVYRLFMAFYGLVFPAYAWIVMLPRKRPISMTLGLGLTALAVLAAVPFFWLGFIEEKTVWLLPGVAIVILARLVPLPAGKSVGG